ncbi:MAG: hypothetical protein FD130_62 [Halothiobacillaceae bacterium]|nr:MAG: hypothetical protein FD130_62 [Halothiobacillaceae bacterium]
MKRALACAATIMCSSMALYGCFSDSEADNGVAFTTLSEGEWNGITNQRTEVISGDSNLNGFWLDLMDGVSPATVIPSVDFSQEVVIAVVAQSGNYDLTITRIEPKSTGGLVVHSTVKICSSPCPPVSMPASGDH